MSVFIAILICFVSLFLILLVLVQRGRGGGLAGALGGMGGQSALGTKAGDVFTKITVVVAAVWILLCVLAVKMIGGVKSDPLNVGGQQAPATAPITPGVGSPEENGAAAGAGALHAAPADAAPAGTEPEPKTE